MPTKKGPRNAGDASRNKDLDDVVITVAKLAAAVESTSKDLRKFVMVVMVLTLSAGYMFYSLNIKVESLSDKFESLSDKVESLSDKFESLSDKFESLSEKVESLSVTVVNLVRDLPSIVEAGVISGINREEIFTQEKVGALKLVSVSEKLCEAGGYGQVGTFHAVTLWGRTAMVSAAHFDCNGVIPAGYLACANVDISLKLGCPTTQYMLDISSVAELRDADLAISFGYPVDESNGGIVPRSWVGRFNGALGYNSTGMHFRGNAMKNVHQVADAFVFSATQLGGASGAGVLNSCGYLGVAHMSGAGSSQCYVTPWRYVHNCIRENLEKLRRNSECPSVTPKTILLSPSRSCASAHSPHEPAFCSRLDDAFCNSVN